MRWTYGVTRKKPDFLKWRHVRPPLLLPTPHVILDASSMWRCGTHNLEWSVLRITLRFDGVLSQGRNKSNRLQNRVSRQYFRRTVDWESLEDLERGVWKGARNAEESSYWMAPRARGKCVQQRGASSPGCEEEPEGADLWCSSKKFKRGSPVWGDFGEWEKQASRNGKGETVLE